MEAPETARPGENRQVEVDLARLRALVEESRVDEARAFVTALAAKGPDSPQVQHWNRVLEPPKVLDAHGPPGRALDKERAWLRQHAHEFPGCWMAVYGDRLIASDPDRAKVIAAARRELGPEGAVLFYYPDQRE